MSGSKATSHQQAQQPQLFSQPALEPHKQPSGGAGPKDDQQFTQMNAFNLNAEASGQPGAINLPNNNLRASRQRNHALMKP